MAVASFVAAAPVLDSPVCSSLCSDPPPVAVMNLRSSGGLVSRRKSKAGKHLIMAVPLDLRSSFINSGREWRISGGVHRSWRKQRRHRKLVIANEFAGQYEDGFEDVKAQILNYFTYKAVRTVLHQLYEMNPNQYTWFYDFVATNKPGDGRRFIRSLGKEKHDLAERVMVTRLHLYGQWVKKCDLSEIYKEISNENLDLMRERLIETVIWPSDDKSF